MTPAAIIALVLELLKLLAEYHQGRLSEEELSERAEEVRARVQAAEAAWDEADDKVSSRKAKPKRR